MKKYLVLILVYFGLIISADAANLFAVCAVTCTWDNSSTAMWSASSGGATGQPAPAAGDSVTLDTATCVGGVTCTITVNANISINNLITGTCTASTTGCILDFSAHNNNITIAGQFLGAGSGVRRINMGNGTWTMNGSSGTLWDLSNITNLTFNANGSTIVLPPGKTFFSLGVTYNTIQVTSGGITSPIFNFSGNSFTMNNLIIGASQYISFNAGGQYVINTSMALTGTSGTGAIFFTTTGGGGILNNGTATATWVSIRDTVFAGTAFTATNSFNSGKVTGTVTITNPSGGGGCIVGGWLLWRDVPEHINDNFPAWLEKAG